MTGLDLCCGREPILEPRWCATIKFNRSPELVEGRFKGQRKP
jgi:hypothetical protein